MGTNAALNSFTFEKPVGELSLRDLHREQLGVRMQAAPDSSTTAVVEKIKTIGNEMKVLFESWSAIVAKTRDSECPEHATTPSCGCGTRMTSCTDDVGADDSPDFQ